MAAQQQVPALEEKFWWNETNESGWVRFSGQQFIIVIEAEESDQIVVSGWPGSGT